MLAVTATAVRIIALNTSTRTPTKLFNLDSLFLSSTLFLSLSLFHSVVPAVKHDSNLTGWNYLLSLPSCFEINKNPYSA